MKKKVTKRVWFSSNSDNKKKLSNYKKLLNDRE